MSLFVDAITDINQPGVFFIEVAQPLVIEGIPNGYIGYVFQAPWGPADVAYLPTSGGDLLQTYWPPGSSHTGAGYLGVTRRKKFNAVMVRIMGGAQGLLPPLITGITHGGTTGAVTYKYVVTAVNAAGETTGSQEFATTDGNATLSGSNTNIVAWASVTGAVSYNVYRTFGGATQGKIATAVVVLTLTDTGLAASGAVPTLNTTGYREAVSYLVDSAGIAIVRLIDKWPGTLANTALTAQVAAASDGVANHFNLAITLQDATTGSTTETYQNLQTQATSILPNISPSRLLSAFALINTVTTRPLNGTYTFGGGSDGVTVVASDYDNGLAELDKRNDIAIDVTDDPGNTIRSAVNANLQAHVDNKRDRMCAMQTDPDNTLAQVLTAKQSYVSDRVIFVGAWVTVLDDAGVTAYRSPFSTFIASAIVNLEPQQSHAWWDERVTFYYQGITDILNPQFSTADDTQGGVQSQCTQAGVTLPIRLGSGRFAALNDRTTSSNNNKRFSVTRRIKDFLAKSLKVALEPFTNGPNIAAQWDTIKIGIDNFTGSQVTAGRLIAVDPTDVTSNNNVTTQVAGQFIFGLTGRSPTVMEEIIGKINVGPGVVGVTFQ